MKRKLIFPLLAVFLLTPWPVAYAYEDVLASNAPLQINTVASAAKPTLNVYGKAIGSVNPGDLFYVDTSNISADMSFTLYITNTDELTSQYRYMNLNIGIYLETGEGQWERINTGEAQKLPETFVTMHSGMTSFILPGYARYKITIDGGCFYSYGVGTGEGVATPDFYLTTS